MLVAGEHAGGLAVVAIELVEHLEDGVLVFGVARQLIAHAAVFQGHPRIDAVGIEIEMPLSLRGKLEVLELGPPVVALVERLPRQLQEPGLFRPVVEPEEGDGEVGDAEAGPAIHGLPGNDRVDLAAAPEHRRDDPRVAGGFLILGQGLEQREERPDVVGLVLLEVADGSEPSVGLLVIQDVVDRVFDLRLERWVVEEIGQGDESVEPVGDALPALGLAAEPGALLDVGPEFVEMPAQAVGLDAELGLEPAGRLDAP